MGIILQLNKAFLILLQEQFSTIQIHIIRTNVKMYSSI